jgi:hypothetical protein
VIRTHKLPIKYSPPTLFLFLDFIPTCLDLESITITESMTISFFSNVIVTFLPLARLVQLCFSVDLVFYFLCFYTRSIAEEGDGRFTPG